MFIPSLMKGKFNFHADSVGMGFKNCWVLWSLQIHSGCRSWQNHSTPRTEMSIFSLGLNQPSASLRSEIGTLIGPPLCSQGQRLKTGRTCPPLQLQSCKIKVYLILLFSGALSCQLLCSLRLSGFWLVLIDFFLEVWAVNSAGKAPSSWTRCRTGPAPPEGLRAPKFHAVSATQAVVNISAPRKPNGIVSLYRLFSNDTSGAQMVVSSSILTGLFKTNHKPWCPCFSSPWSFFLIHLFSIALWWS